MSHNGHHHRLDSVKCGRHHRYIDMSHGQIAEQKHNEDRRNGFSSIHFRRSTTSWCMMAICPAGPPKLMKPSFAQNVSASLNEAVFDGTEFFSLPMFAFLIAGFGLGPRRTPTGGPISLNGFYHNRSNLASLLDPGIRMSRPYRANPTVPITPKTNAEIRFVSGLICHKKAPPRAATLTATSRSR